jgi:hypothetical protein
VKSPFQYPIYLAAAGSQPVAATFVWRPHLPVGRKTLPISPFEIRRTHAVFAAFTGELIGIETAVVSVSCSMSDDGSSKLAGSAKKASSRFEVTFVFSPNRTRFNGFDQKLISHPISATGIAHVTEVQNIFNLGVFFIATVSHHPQVSEFVIPALVIVCHLPPIGIFSRLPDVSRLQPYCFRFNLQPRSAAIMKNTAINGPKIPSRVRKHGVDKAFSVMFAEM